MLYTVYPKKYAHGFCFVVLCCGYTLTDFPISIRLTSLALWQSNDCPSGSKATLMNMDKYFMWIHYERLHNHNKAKHNKTVCIFLGIYCKMMSWHGNAFCITGLLWDWMFSLMLAWLNCSVNNWVAYDLRHHENHLSPQWWHFRGFRMCMVHSKNHRATNILVCPVHYMYITMPLQLQRIWWNKISETKIHTDCLINFDK